MKYSDIIKTANSNMMRSKLRSLLTIIAIFVGALTLTLTNGIGSGVSSYIDKQLGNIGAEDVLIIQANSDDPFAEGLEEYNPEKTTSANEFGIPTISSADIDRIGQLDNIISIEPAVMLAPDYIEGANGAKYKFTLQQFVEGTNLEIAHGQTLDNEGSENQIVLGLGYAEDLGYESEEAAINSTVSIGATMPDGQQQEVQARIVGIQERTLVGSIGGGMANQSLSEELDQIRNAGLPEAMTGQHMAAIARVPIDISEEDLNSLKATLNEQGFTGMTVQDQIGIFKQVIDAIIMVLNFFAAIALLAASFGIVNTLLMAVQERTKEIGLMKAMGMRSRRIFALFSFEAILLGFWGSLLGSLAGIGIGKIVNNIAANSFLKELPGFDLMSFPITSVLTIMVVIMVIAFLAGTLPARRASKKDPIEALRYE